MTSFEETMMEFIDTLDEREKMVRELYIKHDGDMVAIATGLGITKGQASRIWSRVYFKSLQFAGGKLKKD